MRRRVSSLFLPSLHAGLVVALLVAAGCGSRPVSPQALFHEVARLNGQGRYGAIWDLTHQDGKARFMKSVDDIRETVSRNKHRMNEENLIHKQFHVSTDEFFRMDYFELFVKENEPGLRAMEGAEILDQQTDPLVPTDVLLTWQTVFGDKFIMRCRYTDGGWWLVRGTRRL